MYSNIRHSLNAVRLIEKAYTRMVNMIARLSVDRIDFQNGRPVAGYGLQT
jgi:hypothetical protein